MNLKQIQILEYALNYFSEIHEKKYNAMIKMNLIFESESDVFQAESYLRKSSISPVNQRLTYEKEVVNESLSHSSFSSSSFQVIRSRVYDFFNTDWGPVNTMSLVENPHLLLENLIQLSNGLEADSIENRFWYNYQSLKYDYSLEFKIIDPSATFSVISLSLEN